MHNRELALLAIVMICNNTLKLKGYSYHWFLTTINAMLIPETTPTTTPMTAIITSPIMIGVASLLSCFFSDSFPSAVLNAIVIIIRQSLSSMSISEDNYNNL